MMYVLKHISRWYGYYSRLKLLNTPMSVDDLPLKFVLAAEYYEAEYNRNISEQHKTKKSR